MIVAGDPKRERRRCGGVRAARPAPTCGSCSGMFTANSMNCLARGFGPGAAGKRNRAGHAQRPPRKSSCRAGGPSSIWPSRLLRAGRRKRAACAPRSRSFEAFRECHDAGHRDGRLDEHGSASAGGGAGGRDALYDGRHRPPLARRVPNLCKVAPSAPSVHLEDVHRAGGIFAILARRGGWSDRPPDCCCIAPRTPFMRRRSAEAIRTSLDAERRANSRDCRVLSRRSGRRAHYEALQPKRPVMMSLHVDRAAGVIRDLEHAFSQGRRAGRSLRQHCRGGPLPIVKTPRRRSAAT